MFLYQTNTFLIKNKTIAPFDVTDTQKVQILKDLPVVQASPVKVISSPLSTGVKHNQVSRPPHIGSLPSSYNQVQMEIKQTPNLSS